MLPKNKIFFRPTIAHYFIKLLDSKGLLLRHYTQNIDSLEDLTGLDQNKTGYYYILSIKCFYF
jgi:NAD-dependent SIR2 family protein deacetylase